MLDISFSPFPELATERLSLRCLKPDDAPEVFFLRSNPRVQKYIKRPPAVHLDDAKEFITKILTRLENNESILWGIVPKDQQKLIGTICLWNLDKVNAIGEVGYELHPDCFGKGIMTEALVKVVHFGFNDMKLKRIDAYTNKENTRSINMLERNGFTRNTAFEAEYEDKEELEYNAIYSLSGL